jgi:hypothetical protein
MDAELVRNQGGGVSLLLVDPATSVVVVRRRTSRNVYLRTGLELMEGAYSSSPRGL